jgi:hypothetical protein
MATMLEAGEGYEPLVWQAGSYKHSNRQISWKLGEIYTDYHILLKGPAAPTSRIWITVLCSITKTVSSSLKMLLPYSSLWLLQGVTETVGRHFMLQSVTGILLHSRDIKTLYSNTNIKN